MRAQPRQRQRGQSVVEFSVMLVAILILLMGILDLGRMYFTYLSLEDAAAEGAYFGAAFPQCLDNEHPTNIGCASPNNIEYRIQNSAPAGGLVQWTDTNATISVALPGTLAEGELMTVTVQYPYKLITPFVGAIAPNQTLTLTARSTAFILRVPNCAFSPCQ